MEETGEEIEVTKEMIEAGASAIFEWREVSTAWDLAEEVYRAMERVKRDRRSPKEKLACF